MNSVWVITWAYTDGSESGMLPQCYDHYNPAYHVCDKLRSETTDKTYMIVELGIIKGDLQ